MNFVAQFRIVQRLIMMCTVIWIVVVMYKTGIIDSLKTQLTLAVGGVQEEPSPYHNVFNQSDPRLHDSIKDILRDRRMASSVNSIVHHVGTSNLSSENPASFIFDTQITVLLITVYLLQDSNLKIICV